MKSFNTAGACSRDKNYMVNLDSRLNQIKAMVDLGQYFTINRARQYGKTTTLRQLRLLLKDEYAVVSLDFQKLSDGAFSTEDDFVRAFARLLLNSNDYGLISLPATISDELGLIIGSAACARMDMLFHAFIRWCRESDKPIVLMIDEVDSATNNQVFLDFLAQLRSNYLEREDVPTFQSVILAGVTDIKNMKRKIRPDEAHKFNSPWNIAADFNVDMSFNTRDIAGMLTEYEADHHTGMDIDDVAQTIEDYTSGYPFLVSRICQLLDSDDSVPWNRHGVGEIVRRILIEKNTLFDSLMGKVHDNDKLREILQHILFSGETMTFNAYDIGVSDAQMFGLVRNNNGTMQISNRIFETLLYNFFLSQEELNSPTYQAATEDKQQFIRNGRLDMEYVLQRYVEVYTDLYGGSE